MTKEELEKEAKVELAYVIAEPREKQIQIDAEQIRALQKQNGELTDRVRELEAQIEKLQKDSNEWQETLAKEIELVRKRSETIKQLEAQIEKMKCCENCRYCNEWGEANSNSPNCKKCNWVSNWKLRR